MGPRKKIKPNKAETEQQASDGAQDQEQHQAAIETPPSKDPSEQKEIAPNSAANDTIKITSEGPGTPQSTSWYGGTWPRTNKSTPVTKVAKESISAAGNAAGKVASEVVASARASSPRPPSISSPLKSPANYLSRGAATSTRSLPLAAASTKLNITSSGSDSQSSTAEEGLRRQSNASVNRDSKPQQVGKGDEKEDKPITSTDRNGTSDPEPPNTLYSQRPPEPGRPANDSAAWLGWFTKVNNTGSTASSRPQTIIVADSSESPPSPSQRRNSEPNPSSPPMQQGEPPRSWLGIWGSTARKSTDSTATATRIAANASTQIDKHKADKNEADAPNVTPKTEQSTEGTKSYGWAFWSKDDSKDPGEKKRSPSNVGELALAGSPSQSKPENAVIDESKGIPDRVSKRPRPQSMQDMDETQKSTDKKGLPRQEPAVPNVSDSSKTANSARGKAKNQPKNLVLPSFRNTYRTASRPGLVQQLSRLFRFGASSEPRHVEISSPRKVTRALAIGVHGYFPAPLIRSVLGQPTGTSIRFANSVASAIQRRCQEQGYSCEVEKVALEGEGKIAERIDLLWKLMLNWIDKIRKADFVMIACHSQGVPVAMMLISKLIAFGCVNSARIGVCAMAGVNMGPFADYKSRWIGGSAGELFDFASPDSQVSKDYEAALDVALRFGIRIVYIGSIDDQLVSLEVWILAHFPCLPLANDSYSRPHSAPSLTLMSTAQSSSMAASTLPTSSPTLSVSPSNSAT